MNIEAFLAAQLWLRPLPAEAWPASTTTTATAAGRRPGARDPAPTANTGINIRDGDLEGSGSVVILPRARCCFVLENRPSTAAADASKRSGNGRNANKRSRTLYLSTRRGGASNEKFYGDGPSTTSSKDVTDHGDKSASGEREKQSRGGRSSEQSRGDAGISCYGFQQDSNSGTVKPPRGKGQREGFSTETAGSPARFRLACEFDFGLAIAKPTAQGGVAKPCVGAAGGGHRPPAEEEGGGGVLLLRIEDNVYEAEHTLIRSIAYPRGGGSSGSGGAGASSRRGPSDQSGAVKPATSPVDGGNADFNRGRVDERGREPKTAAARASPPPTPPPTASAVAGGKRKLGAPSGDGDADTGRGGSAGTSDGRQAGAGVRGQFDSTEGAAAGGGHGRGDRVGAEEAEAEAEAAQQKKRSEAGTPFCGLFFPGVLLKFWNSERAPARDGGDARAEAVTKMQGVVSEMLAGLSPNRRCDRATSASGTSPQVLECQTRSGTSRSL
ncbi:unnamed protein product [Ectocarpus fasciculatus]